MSLINDMLRNLEAKRPDDPAHRNLQREIRALPAAKSTSRVRYSLLALLIIVAAGSGASIWWQDHAVIQHDAVPAPPVTPAPAVVMPATAAPPPVVPTVNPENDENLEKLRLVSSLTMVPLSPAVVPDPVMPASAPPAAAASDEKTAPVAPEPAKPTPPPALSGPVKIEKSPVLATPRDRADAEFRKAENAMESGQRSEAMEHLRAAIKIDPAYTLPRQALLKQLLELRKNDEALLVLQEGLEAQPGQVIWAMSLARLQLEQGDLAAAEKTLAKTQPYAEANADYAGFQGHIKSRLGNPRQAVVQYQRATRLAPGEGRWWLGLGLALEADGRSGDAKEALRRAVASGTLSPELVAVAEQHLR